ncbi:MAG: hypothetical protein DCC71_06005 [Proteobacteria bacterium]|nr:MAG: hypothetical protein DCC71_06005 [Pseudomonadota bacterium]
MSRDPLRGIGLHRHATRARARSTPLRDGRPLYRRARAGWPRSRRPSSRARGVRRARRAARRRAAGRRP